MSTLPCTVTLASGVTVTPTLVQATAKKDLPDLISQLEQLIADADELALRRKHRTSGSAPITAGDLQRSGTMRNRAARLINLAEECKKPSKKKKKQWETPTITPMPEPQAPEPEPEPATPEPVVPEPVAPEPMAPASAASAKKKATATADDDSLMLEIVWEMLKQKLGENYSSFRHAARKKYRRRIAAQAKC